MDYDFMAKIIVIGNSAVGKSGIIQRFDSGQFTMSAPTVGVEIVTKTVSVTRGGQTHRVKLNVLDTAGQEKFQSVTAQFFRNAAGAVLVYDITNESSFENIPSWLDALKGGVSDPSSVALILVGNKADLEEHRVITQEEGKNLADSNGMMFIETSALNGQNIEEAFDQLIADVTRRRLEAAGITEDTRQNLVIQPAATEGVAKQGGCCK